MADILFDTAQDMPMQATGNNTVYAKVLSGVSGLLASLVASVVTTGTTAFTFMTLVIPGNQLRLAGQTMRIRMWGQNSADINAKTLTVNYGSLAFPITITNAGASLTNWHAEVDIVRTANATQTAFGHAVVGVAAVTPASAAGTQDNTVAAGITVTIQGTAATAGTITLTGASIEQVK